jgi:DNA-binding GntR family transcriptional regulator
MEARKKTGISRAPRGAGAGQAYAALRERILKVELAPGSKLDEMGLVEELGCSRTPVREALIRLAADGLVTILPNYGARVTSLDLLEIAQYFEALELSQRIINHLAARRRTDADLAAIRARQGQFDAAVAADDADGMIRFNRDFHSAIGGACGNGHLHTMADSLLDQGMRLNWLWHSHFDEEHLYSDIERSCREHAELVDAIASGDAPAAERIGSLHVATFRDRVKDLLETRSVPDLGLWA